MSLADKAGKLLGALEQRMDEWQNAVTALGTSRDKTVYSRFVRRFAKNEAELEALFDFNDMAFVVAAELPTMALRKGVSVKLDDPAKTTRLHEELDRLDMLGSLHLALVWERVYGGGALYMGLDDGLEQHEPVNPDRVAKLDFLTALDKRDLTPRTWYQDPLSPKFGLPELYDMGSANRSQGGATTGKSVTVHESRLILFRGALCSNTLRRERQGWGGSQLDRSYEALRLYGDNWQSVKHIMSDASQGVFKMKGLIDMLGSNMRAIVMERMRQVDMQRSNARALQLDADREDFERRDTNMSGLPELLDRTGIRLAASARMPVSVLLGREPSGLNATGEMDMRAWYDQGEGYQRDKCSRPIRTIAIYAMRGLGLQSASIDVVWPRLWTPTPNERADLEQKHAATDAIRVVQLGIPAEQINVARYRPEGYQDDLVLDMSYQAEALAVIEAEASKGGELPPVSVTPDDAAPEGAPGAPVGQP